MTMEAKELSRCGVLIAGGTAGVGLETAARFAMEGARVVLVGRNDGKGAAACESVRQRVPGAQIHFVKGDAAIAAEATRVVDEAQALLGTIDVLICAMGPSEPPRLLHLIPIEKIKPLVEEVTFPAMHMTHAVLQIMRAQKSGSIINVTSDAAKQATPGETLIGAALSAVTMFSKAAALEAKRDGVRINLLTPSLIADTPGAELIFKDAFAAKMFQKAAGMAHLGVADPTDLAEAALFLASPRARRITGQTLSVNGGISVG